MTEVSVRRNKRGSASVFLAIILAAVLTVEGIYLALVIDINRRITIDRALKIQVETIIANYNEELFLEYGLYGFSFDTIDTTVYKRVLDSTGYSYGEDIYIDGYRTINTIQLEKALSNYYAYRTPALAISKICDTLSFVKNELISLDFFGDLKKFMNSGGKEVTDILNNALDSITDLILDDEFLELVDDSSNIVGFKDFLNTYQYVNNAELDFDSDFDPNELSSFNYINGISSTIEDYQGIIGDNFSKLCVAHYIVNNFECCINEFEIDGQMVEDSNLRGTHFSELSESNYYDMEQIIFGVYSEFSLVTMGTLTSAYVYLINVLKCYFDKDFMNIVSSIADIASAVLTVVLEGVVIPSWVIELLIIDTYAKFKTIMDMATLYSGKSITIVEIENLPLEFDCEITMNYKDFALFIASTKNINSLMDSIIYTLESKYGVIGTSIEVATIYQEENFYAELGYELYGF